MRRLWHTLTLYHLREDVALCDCGYVFSGTRHCPIRIWGWAQRTRRLLKRGPYGEP